MKKQDLEKALEILEILAEEGDECSISALSRKAGISRYRTVRLLEGVERKGGMQCAVESGRYDRGRATLLGDKLLRKAASARHGRKIVESFLREEAEAVYRSMVMEVRPVMESLARKHNEAVYMAVLKGEEVLIVDVAGTPAELKGEALVGRQFPFFRNAAGKVMRAIDSWDLLEKLGKRWQRGRSPSPELSDLQSELDLIREKGVAVDCGSMGEGMITVAVVVKDYAGKVVGALAMLGPQVRLIGERLENEIIPSLLSSGEMLSMKFGYLRP